MAKPIYRNIIKSGKSRYYVLTKKPMRKGHKTRIGKVIKTQKIKKPTIWQRIQTGD